MALPENCRSLEDAIRNLRDYYGEYMAWLNRVVELGENDIPTLVAALKNKHANPIAQALGLMMHSRDAEKAIPRLLDWLLVQSPLYPDALNALVRAGDRSLPLLRQRIPDYAAKGDDEAVRNLLDLGSRLPETALPEIVSIARSLLESANADVREAAADAVWRIGLPHGRPAEPELRRVALGDESESARISAKEALARLGLD